MLFTKKRPDGTYIKGLHFFTQLLPYLMPTRTEAYIHFEREIDVTKTLEYLRIRKRSEKGLKISLFYITLYSAMRALAVKPKMNRFVSGHRYYQRNRISFNFIAKRQLTEDGEEVNVTMSFSPFLSLEDFCKKIHDYVLSLINGKEADSEKINSFITHMPRFIIKFFVRLVKFLDYHNGLPKSVINSLPFFSTIFFTNVGSVGIDAPIHHNFEIGNCGIFCALGKLRKEKVIKHDNTFETRDKVKIIYTFDDRVTDGIYCARAIDMMCNFIENPEQLEQPLELTEEQIKELGLAKKEL